MSDDAKSNGERYPSVEEIRTGILNGTIKFAPNIVCEAPGTREPKLFEFPPKEEAIAAAVKAKEDEFTAFRQALGLPPEKKQ